MVPYQQIASDNREADVLQLSVTLEPETMPVVTQCHVAQLGPGVVLNVIVMHFVDTQSATNTSVPYLVEQYCSRTKIV